jgi:hypothetical protein
MAEERLRLKACDKPAVRTLADEFFMRATDARITRDTMHAVADALLGVCLEGAALHRIGLRQVNEVTAAIRRGFLASRHESQLTPLQKTVLDAVARHVEPVSTSWLVHETGLSRGSMNSVTQILVDRGLITKQVVLKSSYFSLVREEPVQRVAASC